MLFASAVAAVTWFAVGRGGVLCTSTLRHGANVHHAFVLVLVSGVVGALLLFSLRNRQRLSIVVMILGAATLVAALVLVGHDSARYLGSRQCDNGGLFSTKPIINTNFNDSLVYLYPLWGLPAAFLVWSGLRRFARPEQEREQQE